MTTTNKLREKICAACPELLELRFGCKVFEDNEKIRRFEDPDVSNRHLTVFRTDVGRGDIALGQEHTSYITFIERYFTETNVVAIAREKVENNPDRYKILGSPPTLEHLLRAFPEPYYLALWPDDKLEIVASDATRVMYNLRLPPLEQSPAVQEALVALLE